MNDLTISLLQADLHWEEIDANLAMFEEQIWGIEEDTDLIILPEMFTTGFSMNGSSVAEPPGGKTFKWMRLMASQKQAAVTGSYIIKEGDHYYNRLYFVFPDGSSEQYDKKHLFTLASEHEAYEPGQERLIVEYKGWKIHTMICYDLRFPVWARSQKKPGASYEYDLLLYVANWPEPRINAWDALLKARAIENLSFCVGVNRIGTDAFPKDYPGHSAVYGYDGREMCFSEKKTEAMTVKLSHQDLTKFRDRFSFQEDSDSFELK